MPNNCKFFMKVGKKVEQAVAQRTSMTHSSQVSQHKFSDQFCLTLIFVCIIKFILCKWHLFINIVINNEEYVTNMLESYEKKGGVCYLCTENQLVQIVLTGVVGVNLFNNSKCT